MWVCKSWNIYVYLCSGSVHFASLKMAEPIPSTTTMTKRRRVLPETEEETRSNTVDIAQCVWPVSEEMAHMHVPHSDMHDARPEDVVPPTTYVPLGVEILWNPYAWPNGKAPLRELDFIGISVRIAHDERVAVHCMVMQVGRVVRCAVLRERMNTEGPYCGATNILAGVEVLVRVISHHRRVFDGAPTIEPNEDLQHWQNLLVRNGEYHVPFLSSHGSAYDSAAKVEAMPQFRDLWEMVVGDGKMTNIFHVNTVFHALVSALDEVHKRSEKNDGGGAIPVRRIAVRDQAFNLIGPLWRPLSEFMAPLRRWWAIDHAKAKINWRALRANQLAPFAAQDRDVDLLPSARVQETERAIAGGLYELRGGDETCIFGEISTKTLPPGMEDVAAHGARAGSLLYDMAQRDLKGFVIQAITFMCSARRINGFVNAAPPGAPSWREIRMARGKFVENIQLERPLYFPTVFTKGFEPDLWQLKSRTYSASLRVFFEPNSPESLVIMARGKAAIEAVAMRGTIMDDLCKYAYVSPAIRQRICGAILAYSAPSQSAGEEDEGGITLGACEIRKQYLEATGLDGRPMQLESPPSIMPPLAAHKESDDTGDRELPLLNFSFARFSAEHPELC